MNDEKFLNANRTGIFKHISKQGNIKVPAEIRKAHDLTPDSLVEIIPLYEGFYVRKARGKRNHL